MDIDGIKDRESLEAWLKTRPREDAVAIAHRAALRVFPLFGREMGEDWARKGGLTSLPVLQCLLIAGVEHKYPTPEIRVAASAAESVSIAAAFAVASAASAASASVASAASASVASASVASASAASIAAVGGSAAVSVSAVAATISLSADVILGADSAVNWAMISVDADLALRRSNLAVTLLWLDSPPDWFTEADRETRAIWAERPEHWEFWTRWWDAVLAGTPLDWDLQRDIALIPDELWQQGPGPVATEIARLEELHTLRRDLAELKRRIEQPEQVVENIAGADLRGHNNPPELIETPGELRETLVVVWEVLREAESELAKPSPEPARLRQAGQTMLSAAKSIVAYCFDVGDVVVKNAAKGVGAALGVGIVAAILGNLPAIMSFAEKLIAFGTRWTP